ncbi:MAG TPA: hypothetical protein VF812_01460 [Ktedonobacterales bacterium]
MRQPPVIAALSAAAGAPRDVGAPSSRAQRALRIVFVALTIVTITLDALAIPILLPRLSTPDVLRELHRIHFSAMLYAAIQIVENTGYALIYLAMALLLFWRRPNDRMAVFCALTLVLFGCATTGGFLYDIGTGETTPILGASGAAHIVILLLFSGGQMCFLLFFYLFPSGRFAPRWTRWLAALAGVYWLAVVFDPTIPVGPLGAFILFFIVTAALAQVYRYWRISTPIEREQTKWVVFGFFLGAMIILAPQLVFAVVPHEVFGPLLDNSPLIGNLVFGAPWVIGLALIPIFIAVAVLRSHLWDIDTLINRTLVYGVLTALLVALYAGLTIGLQRLSGVVTGSASTQPAVIVVSTLAIAALVQPLRGRIQAIIDQRFYRSRYDAAHTVSTFSATLRQEIDLDDLRGQLLDVVDATMRPSHCSLWLTPPRPPSPHDARR